MRKDLKIIRRFLIEIRDDQIDERLHAQVRNSLTSDYLYSDESEGRIPLNDRLYHLVLMYEDGLIKFYGTKLQLTNKGHDEASFLESLSDEMLERENFRPIEQRRR